MPKSKYKGVNITVMHNGGRHTATYIVPQSDPYYNPMEALELVLPAIKKLHDVIMITLSQEYQ